MTLHFISDMACLAYLFKVTSIKQAPIPVYAIGLLHFYLIAIGVMTTPL